jgi:hypothetical protein
MTEPERRAIIATRVQAFDYRPDFAPITGRCFRCGLDLVEYYEHKYPVVEITGCPSCAISYVE